MSTSKNKCQEITETIRGRITSGEYTPGRRIPSQSEMADEFGVSERTVAFAIAALRENGYVWTLPHKGSYARPRDHWRTPDAATTARRSSPSL
jgi:DNA-binding GntR family transcriptional regulator